MSSLELRYRILNVFTRNGDRLSGNPLCVFEDGSALSDAQMQALARQFNLSETTFILPATKKKSATSHVRVRIFTPTFEMPFAGHPTLGTAHVVRSLRDVGAPDRNRVVLEMKAGDVEVIGEAGDRWKLRTARPPETRSPTASHGELAAMVGLAQSAIVNEPLWVNTGAEQLVIPVKTAEDVRRAKPSATLLGRHGFNERRNASMAYVWAPVSSDEEQEDQSGERHRDVLARFFFLSHDNVIEDPATGSACANLGGWYLAKPRPLPMSFHVHQGEAIGRPSLLHLTIDEDQRIFVAGNVVELGAGTLQL